VFAECEESAKQLELKFSSREENMISVLLTIIFFGYEKRCYGDLKPKMQTMEQNYAK
jgi:hypothetical protein